MSQLPIVAVFRFIILRLEERRIPTSSRKVNPSDPQSEIEYTYENLGWFVTIRDSNSNAPDLTWGLGFEKPNLKIGGLMFLTFQGEPTQ